MTSDEIAERTSTGRRDRLALAGVVAACVVILISTVAATTAFLRGEDTRAIVERDPCLVDPGGRLCQQSSRDADRHQTLRDACIRPRIFLTADAYRSQTRCPEREETADGPATSSRPDGEPAAEPGSTGGTAPADDPGGSSGGDGDGPAQPPTSRPPTQPPPVTPSPPPLGDTPPSASDQVGGGLGETIDGVTGAACQVTDLLGVCVR